MFTSDILRKIYQIRKDPQLPSSPKSGLFESIKKAFSIRDHHQQEVQKRASVKDQLDFDSIQTIHLPALQRRRQKQQLGHDDIDDVLLAFIHRASFTYGLKRMIEYVVKCICLKKSQKLRKDPQGKVHYLYKKGEKKLKGELDVIQLLKSLRKFKLLQQAMLPQKSRMLLQYQRFNLIETESSSSDSDDEKMQTVQLMENKNPLIRLVMYGKVTKMISQFKDQKLEPLELNLFRGVFQRRLKDFSDELNEIKENKILIKRMQTQITSFFQPQSGCDFEEEAYDLAYEYGLNKNDSKLFNDSNISATEDHLRHQISIRNVDEERIGQSITFSQGSNKLQVIQPKKQKSGKSLKRIKGKMKVIQSDIDQESQSQIP
ncbi:UNKNOWN [Stylonychia lemnae]|uniref:Uncharacterized protein n=1 Tax=Stylonychia lemnae TaxID=5949 RepID=A0A078AX20_STYLE|nr:UNKNOWN [Stylonychia lemnae]|eukprot:CDW86714.1 UNKNOWN [Stylonychia lemnae]